MCSLAYATANILLQLAYMICFGSRDDSLKTFIGCQVCEAKTSY